MLAGPDDAEIAAEVRVANSGAWRVLRTWKAQLEALVSEQARAGRDRAGLVDRAGIGRLCPDSRDASSLSRSVRSRPYSGANC